MKYFERLKSFFFLLRKNEFIGITALLGALALLVGVFNFNRFNEWRSLRSENQKRMIEQSVWFRKEPAINEKFRSIVDQILTREKIDQPKLMSIVSNAAKRLSLNYTIGIPVEETGQFFSFNKISIQLQNVDFSSILAFDEAIELKNSNMCIDDMDLVMQGKAINAKLCINALDVKSNNDIEQLVARILDTQHLSDKIINWNDKKNLLE